MRGLVVLVGLLAPAAAAQPDTPSPGEALPQEAGPTPLSPDGLPEVALAYDIEARVDPGTRALSGTVRLRWRHPGGAPLTEIPIHAYLNAFSHLGTTWVPEATALRGFDLEEIAEVFDDPWGYTTFSAATADGRACAVRPARPDDGNPLDRSLALVTLPAPLAEGEVLELVLTFDARLPVPIARTGCHPARRYCHVAQWFPKLAYYDAEGRFGPPGFAAHQFHGSTEFFAPFADWRVTIDAPDDLALVATGQREAEAHEAGRQRVVYAQRAVHDFTFVLGPDLVIDSAPHQPAGGGPEVLLTVVTQPETPEHVVEMRESAALSLDLLSTRVGPYAWRTLTVVEPPLSAAATAGMEYQTLVTALPGDTVLDLAPVREAGLSPAVIGHEIAHNWFQGMIASNELDDAFLDEGLARYWEIRISRAWAADHGASSLLGLPSDPADLPRLVAGISLAGIDQHPLSRPSWLLAPSSAVGHVYERPALIFETAARRYGERQVDALFSAWYERWRFGHPTGADLLAEIARLPDDELRDFLSEAFQRAELPELKIVSADSAPWQSPLGRIEGAEGPEVTERDRDAHTAARRGLDPVALEVSGARSVVATIQTSARTDGDPLLPGSVEQVALGVVEGQIAGASEGSAFHVGTATVEGPGWEHLPVTVRFTFDDGVVVDDPWDGRARRRSWRFGRPARLVAVQIDPLDTLALEGTPADDAWRLEPDTAVTSPWAAAVARLAAFAMALAGLWP